MFTFVLIMVLLVVLLGSIVMALLWRRDNRVSDPAVKELLNHTIRSLMTGFLVLCGTLILVLFERSVYDMGGSDYQHALIMEQNGNAEQLAHQEDQHRLDLQLHELECSTKERDITLKYDALINKLQAQVQEAQAECPTSSNDQVN